MYSWPNSIRMRRWRECWVGRIARDGRLRNTYQDFSAEAEGKRIFGRSSMDGRLVFKWIVLLDVVEWIYLTEGRVQWWLWWTDKAPPSPLSFHQTHSWLEGRHLFLKQELVLVNRQCDSTEPSAMLPLFIVGMITRSRLQGALLQVLVYRQYDYIESAARCPAASVSLSSVWLHGVGCKMPCCKC